MAESIMPSLYRNTYTEDEINKIMDAWTRYQFGLIQGNIKPKWFSKTYPERKKSINNFILDEFNLYKEFRMPIFNTL